MQQQFGRMVSWSLFLTGALLCVISCLQPQVEAAPSPSLHPGYFSDLDGDEPRYEILEMLARLGQNMIRDDLENNEKRSRRAPLADFGFGRGYSGKIEAQHRFGQDFALDPFGPGKRSFGANFEHNRIKRNSNSEILKAGNLELKNLGVSLNGEKLVPSSLHKPGHDEIQRRLAKELADNPAGPGK